MNPPTKYQLEPPAGVYPVSKHSKVYPDFEPWKHKPIEDKLLLNFVAKGYYEPAKVSFETISAKSSVIQEPLSSLASRLSSNFTEVFKIREERVNKISNIPNADGDGLVDNSTPNPASSKNFFHNLSGKDFRLPRRVTLTDAKREQWLQDLTDSDVKMNQLVKSIPHGFKRKQLLEQLYLKQVPFSRAIWLIKYCYCVEWSVLSSRAKQKNEYNNLVSKIYQEWTSSMVQLLERLVFDMSLGADHSIPTNTKKGFSQNSIGRKYVKPNIKSPEFDNATPSSSKSFAQSPTFSLNEKISPNFDSNGNDASNKFKRSDGNTKSFSAYNGSTYNKAKNAQHEEQDLLTWKSNIKYFLKLVGNCYGLGLMDKYLFINWLVEFFSKMENFEFYPITLHILTSFWSDVVDNGNSDSFILGKITESLLHSYYMVSHSKSMLNDSNFLINDVKKNEKIRAVFLKTLKVLISQVFHHQSLEVFVMTDNNKWNLYKPCLEEILEISQCDLADEVRKKFDLITYRNDTLKKNFETINSNTQNECCLQLDTCENLIILRANFDLLKLLDNNKPSDDWDAFLNDMNTDDMFQMFLWVVSPNRTSHYESVHLVARLLIMRLSIEGKEQLDIENEFWKMIFLMAKANNLEDFVDFDQLRSLTNVLIVYGIVKVPTYIRKLISSGVLYSPNQKVKKFHCDLLISLKIQPVMKYQFNMVLKKVDDKALTSGFRFDQLVSLAEQCKQVFIAKSEDKTLLREASWFSIGDEEETPFIESATIKRVYSHLCLDLQQFHHFYRWIEFIVYHQQLSDIGAMEQMIDILLAFQKLFPLLINDPLLFMKSTINLYLNKLKSVDSRSFQIIQFNSFWKFFLTSFDNLLQMDASLHHQLSELCEIENERLREFSKANHQLALTSNQQLGKKFRDLITAPNEEELANDRLCLLSIQIVSRQDYAKYIPFILKRKRMEAENTKVFLDELVLLLSLKLISLDFINKIFGNATIFQVLTYDTTDPYVLFQKKHYIKQNYEAIVTHCIEVNDLDYLAYLILTYGSSLTRARVTNNTLKKVFPRHPDFIFALLRTHLDNASENQAAYLYLFAKLNFSNLFIFQAFVQCLLTDESFLLKELGTMSMKVSLILESCHYSFLVAHLFDTVSNPTLLNAALEIVLMKFLNECFIREGDSAYVNCNKSLITALTKLLKTQENLKINETVFENFEALLNKCFRLHMSETCKEAKVFNILIELLIIFERPLFDYIVAFNKESFVTLLYQFFQNKPELSLKNKLFIYEILHHLKSQYTYLTTLDPLKLCQIPQELVDLPPFHLSSFDSDCSVKSTPANSALGLSYIDHQEAMKYIKAKYKNLNEFHLYNRKYKNYEEMVQIPEFLQLANYAEDKHNRKLNNTFVNLSLFDAKLERKDIA
ncbi:hypothetical protein ACO0QE_000831 [Hanseniaspora vineae]